MKKYKWWEEDAPVNATGPAVVGTGDDSSTVVVRKKVKVYRRKKRMTLSLIHISEPTRPY